ncbi:Clp protease N-terminal domain-containing protein [Cryptosporangium minutisporangium]|uniref:Clp protease N-terminal domain-containing protein n=1 Tax=Cryptosporangium minutisporangium TaxID=113569 RepID=A0ABP6T604_9ACTN
MFERFTKDAREVVVRAQAEGRELRHPVIGTEHLLLAMLADDTNSAYPVLHAAGLRYDQVRADVVRTVGGANRILTDDDAEALKAIGIDLDAVLASVERSLGDESWTTPPPEPERKGLFRRPQRGTRFGPRARKVLELSLREAIRLKHREINAEHILLGLIREGEGLAAQVVVGAGVSLADLRSAAEDHLRNAA